MGRIFETRKATMFARWDRMAKAFTRVAKDIAIAVKSGGANPDSNPALRRAIADYLKRERAYVAAAGAELAAMGPFRKDLVVEPISRRVAPWFSEWQSSFETAGGSAADWRFRVTLPPLVARLDRSAGLDHRELTARTLSAGFRRT